MMASASKALLVAVYLVLAISVRTSWAQYEDCQYECVTTYCDPYEDYCDYDCHEVCYPYRSSAEFNSGNSALLGNTKSSPVIVQSKVTSNQRAEDPPSNLRDVFNIRRHQFSVSLGSASLSSSSNSYPSQSIMHQANSYEDHDQPRRTRTGKVVRMKIMKAPQHGDRSNKGGSSFQQMPKKFAMIKSCANRELDQLIGSKRHW